MGKDDRRGRVTGGRDAAGIGPHLREGMQLTPLKELEDHRLADGEPDIRGWEVQTVSGRKIGEVDDVLVDEASGEVVLLDVDLVDNRRRTLAPARAVQLMRDRRVVLIDSTELRDAEQLPTLARTGEVTADELRLFRDSYAQLYGARAFHGDRDYEIRRGDQEVRLTRNNAADTAHEDAAAVTAADAGTVEAMRGLNEERVVGREASARRDVRFPREGPDEVVVERRPVVMEEVVVRRRAVEPHESTDAVDAERLGARQNEERELTDAERRARDDVRLP